MTMCRLFGMHAGRTAVDADFWLEESADSLSVQSHRNPDGFGIGTFSAAGEPIVEKEPRPAWESTAFDRAAHRLRGTTFVAHVRKASTGALVRRNTHPFLQDGRLFAHNGVISGLDRLDERLDALGVRELVDGDTDSERAFALITAEIRRHDGDVRAGIIEAVGWIASNLPVYSLNFVLITPGDVWALRYPATHQLFVLERPSPGESEGATRTLQARGSQFTTRSEELADRPSVLVASEPLDGESGWRLLASGELVHVAAGLATDSTVAFPDDPDHLLTLADLDPVSATSQQN
jgi:glutamine amidotransferase